MLYFAYTARIAPDRMSEAAPDSSFEFIAHLPEWGLAFPVDGNGWGGSLPAASPVPGSTVWGAVFRLSEQDAEAVDAIETAEGRDAVSVYATDRTGKRHKVTTHIASGDGSGGGTPAEDYVQLMLSGSRHWGLPAGWIVQLEDRIGAEF